MLPLLRVVAVKVLTRVAVANTSMTNHDFSNANMYLQGGPPISFRLLGACVAVSLY